VANACELAASILIGSRAAGMAGGVGGAVWRQPASVAKMAGRKTAGIILGSSLAGVVAWQCQPIPGGVLTWWWSTWLALSGGVVTRRPSRGTAAWRRLAGVGCAAWAGPLLLM